MTTMADTILVLYCALVVLLCEERGQPEVKHTEKTHIVSFVGGDAFLSKMRFSQQHVLVDSLSVVNLSGGSREMQMMKEFSLILSWWYKRSLLERGQMLFRHLGLLEG